MRGAVATAIIALQLFGMCATVSFVGKPRKPTTPGAAVAAVVVSLAFMVGVYWLWKS